MIIQEEIMSALPKLITLELKAENLGFEWPTIEAIIDQAISECDEIRQSIKLTRGTSQTSGRSRRFVAPPLYPYVSTRG